MNEPVVTVVVPGHEVAPYVEEALASLRAQTLTAWCALLVDDGSTDATAALFDRAAADDPRFRVLRLPSRRGLGAARNAGLARVDTPFLGFLDADDVMLPGALERLVAVLDETGSDFVAGAYARLHPDGAGAYRAVEVQPWVVRATSPERRGTTLDDHPEATINVVAWSKLSRTDFWRRAALRFPEGRLYEDQVVAQQMLVRARRFDVVPDVVVHWRVRADGSSITQREDRLDVLRDALDAMTAGLAVLDEAGHGAAAEARVDQLVRMDVPRLAAIAARHPDPSYRRALGRFVRSLADRPLSLSRGRSPLDRATTRVVAAALLW